MRAAYHDTTGGPEVLRVGELPDPEPGPGEVLIRVRATSLDRVDLYWREGSHGMRISALPHVGGRDAAGEVVAVGEGVTGLASGDPVVASGRRTHATSAIAPAVLTLPKPALLTWEQAAAIPTAGRSAHAALFDQARLRPGERVLVTAAGSGVGSFALLLALAEGCPVVVTAGTEAKRATALMLGAAAALDHRGAQEDPDALTAAILDVTDGEGVDVVIDHLGGGVAEACVGALRPWGRYVTTGVTVAHRASIHLGQVFVKGLQLLGVGRPEDAHIRATLADLLDRAGRGDLVPPVAAVLPLERIAEAHALMAAGDHFGKIVLVP